MDAKCLVSFGQDNFVLMVKGSSLKDLMVAISRHGILASAVEALLQGGELVMEVILHTNWPCFCGYADCLSRH